MIKFSLCIEPEVIADIQEAVNYYNSKQRGLGVRFYKTVERNLDFISENYSAFAIRYDDIRCMPVSKFPYLIHYKVIENQKCIVVKAVFCTYENPVKWNIRNLDE